MYAVSVKRHNVDMLERRGCLRCQAPGFRVLRLPNLKKVLKTKIMGWKNLLIVNHQGSLPDGTVPPNGSWVEGIC